MPTAAVKIKSKSRHSRSRRNTGLGVSPASNPSNSSNSSNSTNMSGGAPTIAAAPFIPPIKSFKNLFSVPESPFSLKAPATNLFNSPVLTSMHNFLQNLNTSTFFAGFVMLVLNIGSKYINLNLNESTEHFLKTVLSKEVLVFAVAWMGTRNIYYALVITACFTIIADHLMNERSKYCILPQKFRDISRLNEKTVRPPPPSAAAPHGTTISGPAPTTAESSSTSPSTPSSSSSTAAATSASASTGGRISDLEISKALTTLEQARRQREQDSHIELVKYHQMFR